MTGMLRNSTSPPHAALAGWEHPIDELRECGAYFHSRGWSVGTSSNYSVVLARDPLELCVTASGMDKGRLQRCDFVRTNQNGQPTANGQPKSSAETLLHVVVAQERPEVGCILHTHSVWATLLSDLFAADGGFAIEGYEMLKGFAGVTTHETSAWIEIFENTQDIPSLAEKVRARLTAAEHSLRFGYLIRKHGLYTWGRDVAEARRHIEIFEFLLECTARRMMLAAALPLAAV